MLLVRRGSIETVDGVSMYILEIAQELLRRGVDCYILSGYLNRGGEDLEEYLKSTFGVEKVPEVTAVLGNGSMYKYLFTPIPWAKALAKLPQEIEVIHANNFIPLPPTKHHKIMTVHGPEKEVGVKGLQKIAYRVYINLIAPLYNRIITVSKDPFKQLKNTLLPFFKGKLFLLPPGIDITRYPTRKWSKREDAVLHIGTSPRKNLQTTLNAMKLVWEKYPDIHLYIAGPRSNYLETRLSKLKKIQGKNIHFLGLLSKRDLINFISRVKIFVLPSLYEAFSIATLESMCSGTPVIVSRTVPDILVKHGVNGFKIRDPNDYKSLAHYILRLISDIDLWKNMSYKGKNTCEEFDIRKIVNKLLVIYGLQ